MMIQYDCRFYLGTKPCKHKRVCDGCAFYSPVAERILIIKLGALGDLLRTTPILPSLKKAYPNSKITWVTQKECRPLLANLTEIDEIWDTDANLTLRLMAQEFDLMINFDKDTPAAQAATIARAKIKRGFGLSNHGAMIALNPASEYSLRMGLDDVLKFKINQKTYQEIIHEMAELEPAQSPAPYQVRLTDAEKKFGEDWMQSQLNDLGTSGEKTPFIMGINPGCGKVFATKKWHQHRYFELAKKLYTDYGAIPLLLGGPDESELIDWMYRGLKKQNIPVLRPGENLSLRQFTSVISQCDGLVCGDTLAMHLALAQNVQTVVIFTSTCPQEIELYGIGRTVVGRAQCSPCYLSTCKQPSQFCADSITVDEVFQAVSQQMKLEKEDEKIRRSANF
jgi:ADP-heptose:LPS heptosyltransferase